MQLGVCFVVSDSEAFVAEVERLADGRVLSPADRSAVEAVAGLTMRVVQARRVLEVEGITVEDASGVLKEHPAVGVEKKASQEIRGWVDQRPDLFGQAKTGSPGRRRFQPKIV